MEIKSSALQVNADRVKITFSISPSALIELIEQHQNSAKLGRPYILDEISQEQIRDDFKNGLSAAEIGKKHGIARRTVYLYRDRL